MKLYKDVIAPSITITVAIMVGFVLVLLLGHTHDVIIPDSTYELPDSSYTNTTDLLNQVGPVTITARSWQGDLPEAIQYQVTVRDTTGTYHLCYCAGLYQDYEKGDIVQ